MFLLLNSLQKNDIVAQMWEQIIELLERASKQRHIVALRDGMIGAVPIILVGSTFLLLGAQNQVIQTRFPGLAASAFGQWYAENYGLILMPFRFTMGLLSLYVAFSIAYALAKQYGFPPLPQGLGAAAGLLVTGHLERVEVKGETQWVLLAKPLGAEGLFLAIILGIAMVEISRLFLKRTEEDPAEEEGAIPPAVIQAFASFAPILTLVMLLWLIRHGLGFDLHHFLVEQAKPLNKLGDSLSAVIVVNILLHIFGVAGVHGISVINAAMLPIWQQYVAANAEAMDAGRELVYVTAYPFYQWFIWIGGAGATLAPTILLLFFKHPHMRRIGKTSLIPAMFNINEPMLFGLPVVANPILAIPFIVAPVVCGVVAYGAIYLGLVGKPFIEVPWVMPCFFGSWLSTQDGAALLLLLVNMVISAAIWFPFLVAYQKRISNKSESGATEEEAPAEGSHP